MLKLGLPSKGRLMEKTFDWFGERGVMLRRTGAEREYAASVEGLGGLSLVLLSAGEIPRELTTGRIHLGVTGIDMVREQVPLWSNQIVELTNLGFGHADLVLAVPNCWIDVETLDDLDAVAGAFRRKHGFRLRVATKYHRLVHEHLREYGVADYQLVDSQGATEGTVANLTAEAIADITSTGETLRANHLKILQGEPVLRSQASLFASQRARWDDRAKRVFADLCEQTGLEASAESFGD